MYIIAQTSSFSLTKKITYLSGCLACKNADNLKEKGAHLTGEWTGGSVESSTSDKKQRLSAFRGKIKKHVESQAHIAAENVKKTRKQNIFEQCAMKSYQQVISSTEKMLQTVYYIAKTNCPFSDVERLVQLQNLNGVDLGVTLHSRYSATRIINHIAQEMKETEATGEDGAGKPDSRVQETKETMAKGEGGAVEKAGTKLPV